MAVSIISMRMRGAMRSVTITSPAEASVLRFWNNEIDRNLEGVLTMIDDALRNPPPGLASLGHPPPSGEGLS